MKETNVFVTNYLTSLRRYLENGNTKEALAVLEEMSKNIYNLNCGHLFFKTDKETTQKSDNRVFHPSHYTWLKELCGIEVIDITRHMDFNLGNCIKYILRAGHKEEEGISKKEKTIEDLKKAVFYLNDKIKMLENEL